MSGIQYIMQGTKQKIKKTSNAKSTLVNVPAAKSYTAKTSGPRGSFKSGNLNIKRREFVGTATNGSVTGFSLTPVSYSTPGYDLNPSEAHLFPWLSQIAPCYERFRFKSVSFEFIPSQPTTTAGRYYAAVDYDYDDAVATSKEGLMGNCTAVEAPVWQGCTLTCDPASLNRDMPFRFVSCTTRGLNVEARTTYAGYMMVAFDTSVANCLLDIWVTYDIEFATPVYDSEILQNMVPSVTPPAIANVAPAVGTIFGAPVPPYVINYNRGVVEVINAAAAGISLLLGIGGTFMNIPYALDLKNAMGKGIITLWNRTSVNGVAPSTLLDAAVSLDSLWAVFDSNGTSLAPYPSGAVVGQYSDIGVSTSGQIAVAGNPIVKSTTLPLKSLMAIYPAARFLANYTWAAAAVGAGTTGFGFSYTS